MPLRGTDVEIKIGRMLIETRFRYENEMYPALGSVLHETIFPDGSNALELREMSICGVIPDVLYCRWRSPRLTGLKRPATIIDAHILATLEHTGKSDLAGLCNSLFLSETKAAESLHRLTRQGIIVAKSGGTYVLAKEARTNQVALVAVEMKMFRWRDALEQALSYLRFANQSLVVLDGSQVEVSPKIANAFLTAGVGLLMQHGRFLEVCVRAKSFKATPTPERFIAIHKASLLYQSEVRISSPLPERIEPNLLMA
jgi:hypothetical protein